MVPKTLSTRACSVADNTRAFLEIRMGLLRWTVLSENLINSGQAMMREAALFAGIVQ
jgi:hypothetical protein